MRAKLFFVLKSSDFGAQLEFLGKTGWMPPYPLVAPLILPFFFYRGCMNFMLSVESDWLTLKGCRMGPWLVFVSPCFRENVVATCRIGSFLCSWDNLLQKNVIVLFFGNQISKWRSFEKRAIFDLLFTFSSQQGKVTKIPSAHISNIYIHVFCYWL